MKILRFKTKDILAEARLGVDFDDSVLDLRLAAESFFDGEPGDSKVLAKTLFSADMKKFLSFGDLSDSYAKAIVSWVIESGFATLPKEDLIVLAPITKPEKFICIGLNYNMHADESKMEIPAVPVYFSKYPNTIRATEEDVPLHPETKKLDYEVELAVIIGQRMQRVPESEALNYVYGYTIVNDVSARDLQLEQNTQWVSGKAIDGYAPIGPVIVTKDEFNINQAQLKLYVNDELRQNEKATNMFRTVAYLLSYLSQTITLEVGDIVSTGTPAGVGLGFDPPVYLNNGDVMRAEVSGIGSLVNKVREV